MKDSSYVRVRIIFLLPILLLVSTRSSNGEDSETMSKAESDGNVVKEIYATGSSLPDCSHACGACSPCKRVVVSFKCSAAESCPVVYRCMCNGKYYHVPSN